MCRLGAFAVWEPCPDATDYDYGLAEASLDSSTSKTDSITERNGCRSDFYVVAVLMQSGPEALLITASDLTFLRRPGLDLALIRVLRRIKHVHRKLQEEGSLHDDGKPRVQLRWKWNEDARTAKILLVLGPLNTFLVSLPCPWALL
jgi:hypothetical protein